MKCPYCNRGDFVPEIAIRHAEAYQGGSCHFRCVHCKKIVRGYLAVRVICTYAAKSDNKESDWPE